MQEQTPVQIFRREERQRQYRSGAFFLKIAILLFFILAILEDTGYLARAAFLLDKYLSRIGLSGITLFPLLSSFACAIPGIMATRVIKDDRERLITILIAPR